MTNPQDQGGEGRIEDRRRDDRRSCWLKVKYRDENGWGAGIASDISRGGARVITLNPLELGAPVTIVFENATKTQSKTMRGTVAWQNGLRSIAGPIWRAPGMGIRFAQEAPFPVELLSPNGSKFHLEEANGGGDSGLKHKVLR